ncbi:MAG TPA: hypothetical protein VMK42_11875 [Anaeromyxobacteraceae bacterium]|nr:hypothetical protein [Anaeromyxobacteraceae bacterium]
MLDELRATFGRLLERWGCERGKFNGEPEHAPTTSTRCCVVPIWEAFGLVNNTVSSRLLRRDHGKKLRRHFRRPVLWSRVLLRGAYAGRVVSRFADSPSVSGEDFLFTLSGLARAYRRVANVCPHDVGCVLRIASLCSSSSWFWESRHPSDGGHDTSARGAATNPPKLLGKMERWGQVPQLEQIEWACLLD